jgi:hypothetical protein
MGVTFDGALLIPVLEETLPARFGGGPTDYQLAETEGPDGAPVLKLVVHPRLGEIDNHALIETFLAAMSSKSDSDHMMVKRWRDSGTLTVERREFSTTKSGKINYLHA